MQIHRLLIVVVTVALTACSPDTESLSEERQQHILGQDTVSIATYTHHNTGVNYINVHEDEYTSVEATREVLKERGGRITVLEHGGDRRIQFVINADTFSVDPNRIFTDNGIQMTLEARGSYSTEAHQEVAAFAERLLDSYNFTSQSVVVAMHNNSEGFSIESYTEGGRYASAAEDVYINPNHDISDFYYVTDSRFFDYFSRHGYNVILQNDTEVTDDGSLSVFSGYHNKPYINIEAGHGHHEMQVEMIEVMLKMFEELGYY